MAFDSQILLRDGTTTHLTATEAGTYVAIPPQKDTGLELKIVVPTMAEASDTIVPTVSMSDDGTNAHDVITMPTISYTTVVTNGVTDYFCRVPANRKYIKLTLTCTDADTGSDFDAGHVWAGLVPAGRHQKF